MKAKKILSAILVIPILGIGVWFFNNQQCGQVKAHSYAKAVTKIAGPKTYLIYHRVCRKGPLANFTSTKYFKHAQLQARTYVKTRKGRYWKIIVDGRPVGWVNQHFFRRNQISVAKRITLVANNSYAFPTRDAINYATNATGTAINPAQVRVSIPYVKTKATEVDYHSGKAKARAYVNVIPGQDAVSKIVPKNGFPTVKSWAGSSKGHSRNWDPAHDFGTETRGDHFNSKGFVLRTRLFQPRFLSLPYGGSADAMGQVGVVPEGITVNHGIFICSLFNSSNEEHGHLVSYNLHAIKSKIAAQNLTTMSWPSFKFYAHHIKVSPYLKLGHGQALGSSKHYVYVMANDHLYGNGPRSEEIFQIDKDNLKINQIWTFRISPDRYIHNATFVGDHTMYALFHDGAKSHYEYWRLTLEDNRWQAQEVGATQGNFVTNSPVQGFTYYKEHFWVGFNDNLFEVAQDGTAEKHYHFKTRRELEGLSATQGRLYAELAKRTELTDGRIK